ncbi:MAG TPA: HEAT repeat domain-containing protein [Phycisphaerae bacterium]|nr:HEAT repeat domain-containing protein [Phycisphaerae bacterium]
MKLRGLWPMLGACVLLGGCGAAKPHADPVRMQQLKQRALECLRRGIRYEFLPAVRVQAIESLQDEAPESGLPWIRHALNDEHPAVRFAACMALGTLRDDLSRGHLTRLLEDPDDSVRAAAIFALHRLGDARHTAQLAAFLKDHDDMAVRRNAALILGRLGEKGAIPLLAGVVESPDDGLHAQALESLALLGNEQAMQQLTFAASSGDGPQEVLALNALAMTRDPRFEKTFRYKLEHGDFTETRLAAARGLGELGSDGGLKEAMEGVAFASPQKSLEIDPEENQIMRMRVMAAVALAAIGDPAALPALTERLEDNSDPRVQVAAAKAILRIIRRRERQSMPFRRQESERR